MTPLPEHDPAALVAWLNALLTQHGMEPLTLEDLEDAGREAEQKWRAYRRQEEVA